MPRTQDPGGRVYTVNQKGEIVPAPTYSVSVDSSQPGKTYTQSPDPANTSTSDYRRPPGYHLDPNTGFWVNAQGAVDPNDPAVVGKLHDLNPSGTSTLSYGVDPHTGKPIPDVDPMGDGQGDTSTDYTSFLSIYGLPPDVAAKVHDIFVKNPDIPTATAIAMAYIRGTDWYAKTYPGIKEGIARGLFGDESGYRDYLNKTNGITRQYQGRDIGSDELTGYINQGFTPEHVGQLYQGKAFVTANRGDIQYTTGAFDEGPLSEGDLTALGNESAGIDSELGQKLQRRLNLAQQRLRGVFQGTLASPGLSTANGRLQATSLGGSTTPDVGA